MKLLFIHDHKFRIIDGEYYSSGGLSNEVLSRYVKIFGEVTVLARVILPTRKDEKLSKIINPNITIINSESLTKNDIIKIININDKVIIRLPSMLGIKLLPLVKKISKPYLIELVGCPFDAFWNHSLKGKFIAPIMYLATKKAVKTAPYVLYVTQEFLQNRYQSNGKAIGCSDVSLGLFDNGILDMKLKKIYNSNQPIIIGTIGSLDVSYKGQKYIIKAISILKKQGYNFEYQLVGAGEGSYLKKLSIKLGIEDSIKFMGSISHSEVFDWIDGINIYAQPSLTEGLPRALIEAMSRGCAAIGTDVGGIPELLEEPYLFEKRNIKRICEILKGMDNDILQQQSINNFNKAKQYDKAVLEKSRMHFYSDFSRGVEEKQ